MKLNIAERITLMSILPEKSNIVTMRLMQELRTILGFTDEEIRKYGIKNEGDKISWSSDFEKEIEINQTMTVEIKKRLQEISDKNEVTVQMLPLYEKFGV